MRSETFPAQRFLAVVAALVVAAVTAACSAEEAKPTLNAPAGVLVAAPADALVLQGSDLPEGFSTEGSKLPPGETQEIFGPDPAMVTRITSSLADSHRIAASAGDETITSAAYVFIDPAIEDIYAAFSSTGILEELEELPEDPPGQLAQLSYERTDAEAELESYRYVFRQRNVLGEVVLTGPNGTFLPDDAADLARQMVARVEEAALDAHSSPGP